MLSSSHLPSARTAPAIGGLGNRHLLCAAAAAAIAVALLPVPLATLLVISPVLEETVLRAGLQRGLERRWAGRPWAARAANALSACGFAAAHLATHPGALAALRFLPALVVGHVYRRQHRLDHCIALHAAFNATWLLCSPALNRISS